MTIMNLEHFVCATSGPRVFCQLIYLKIQSHDAILFWENPFLCDNWLHSSTPCSGNYLPTLLSGVKNSEKTILKIPWKTKFGISLNSHPNTFIFKSTLLHTTIDGGCSDGLCYEFLCSLSQSSSADIQR